jgi:hypothetical protein
VLWKKSQNSLENKSKENLNNSDNKKGNKKTEFNLDNHVSLIYWEDDNFYLNSFSEFGEHNYLGALGLNIQENERILIMNVEDNLLFLELNNLECVKFFLFI